MSDEVISKRTAIHRASCAKYRAKMTDEAKERLNMMTARTYYRKKGLVPHEYTSLGRYCKERGYDIEAVMSGDQPL